MQHPLPGRSPFPVVAIVAAPCLVALTARLAHARASAPPLPTGTGSSNEIVDEENGDRRRGRSSRRLQETLLRADAAIRAITSGDPRPYMELWDDGPDVTLFGAWGPIERGPDALRKTFEWVGGRFGPQGGTVPENVVTKMSGSLAYTVGFERGPVQVDGGPLVPMTIRVTQIYGYKRGEWRLLHRHADFPPADQRPPDAAR